LVRQAVKITADTNVLVRAIAGDDPTQSPIAQAELDRAESIALALPVLCELAWVLSRGHKISATQIADALQRLIGVANVVVDRPTAEAGVAMLEAGGDFADGVIAHQGCWLGGDAFVSFDRKAVALIEAQGHAAYLPL
jgi:predicted nucleic-acid-binding protein